MAVTLNPKEDVKVTIVEDRYGDTRICYDDIPVLAICQNSGKLRPIILNDSAADYLSSKGVLITPYNDYPCVLYGHVIDGREGLK